MIFVRIRLSTASFGDVAHNRYCSTLHLIGKCITFFFWKILSNLVNNFSELKSPLPDDKFLKIICHIHFLSFCFLILKLFYKVVIQLIIILHICHNNFIYRTKLASYFHSIIPEISEDNVLCFDRKILRHSSCVIHHF